MKPISNNVFVIALSKIIIKVSPYDVNRTNKHL